MTEPEAQLQVALQHSNNLIDLQKSWLLAMQAQNVLQDMYTRRVRGQLEYQEAKEVQKKKKSDAVKEATQRKVAEEAEVDKKKDGQTTAHQRWSRVLQSDLPLVNHESLRAQLPLAVSSADHSGPLQQLATAVVRWEVSKERCKEDNTKKLTTWESSVKEWEKEQDVAHTEKQKPTWNKPLKPTYASGSLLKVPAKPKLANFLLENPVAPSRNATQDVPMHDGNGSDEGGNVSNEEEQGFGNGNCSGSHSDEEMDDDE
ncbi:hypothetical protein BDP27DRAFT_1490172 [Rhodocollybia butyracea]|uniref:Uncharacterized protein n=1 Tax=Rhodocollybia butyracea TaxID=206335 RepID=A0A9P5PF48_9AGAR|nr:hypothetical protein BDP27DRAFT_1490172 [Rhodocollybia butyracea]